MFPGTPSHSQEGAPLIPQSSPNCIWSITPSSVHLGPRWQFLPLPIGKPRPPCHSLGARGCLLGYSQGSCIHGDPPSGGLRPSAARPSPSCAKAGPGGGDSCLGAVTQINGRALPLSLQLTQSEKKRNQKIQRILFNQKMHAEGHMKETSRPNRECQDSEHPEAQTREDGTSNTTEPKAPGF